MTRYEFLTKLREALIIELGDQEVEAQVEYYNSYIMDEVSRGRSEEEVLEELGDPWVIARSIIELGDTSSGGGNVYSSCTDHGDGQRYEQQREMNRYHVHNFTGWQAVLVILGVIGVLVLVLAVVGGILSLLAPVLVPVLVIVIILRWFSRRN